MTSAGAQQMDLARRLIATVDDMTATRSTTLSDGAIRELPALVTAARQALLDDDDPKLIDTEAACAVELLIALTYARSEQNQKREARIAMFLNSFVTFMKIDLAAAERAAIAVPERDTRR